MLLQTWFIVIVCSLSTCEASCQTPPRGCGFTPSTFIPPKNHYTHTHTHTHTPSHTHTHTHTHTHPHTHTHKHTHTHTLTHINTHSHTPSYTHTCPQGLRSKTRSLPSYPKSTSDLPFWGFDGSSTGQAKGHDSDVELRPVQMYKDPFIPGTSQPCPIPMCGESLVPMSRSHVWGESGSHVPFPCVRRVWFPCVRRVWFPCPVPMCEESLVPMCGESLVPMSRSHV